MGGSSLDTHTHTHTPHGPAHLSVFLLCCSVTIRSHTRTHTFCMFQMCCSVETNCSTWFAAPILFFGPAEVVLQSPCGSNDEAQAIRSVRPQPDTHIDSTYTHAQIHTHIHTHTHRGTHTTLYTQGYDLQTTIHTYTHEYTHMRSRTYTHTQTCAHTDTGTHNKVTIFHIHIHTYTHHVAQISGWDTHTHTHTHTHRALHHTVVTQAALSQQTGS